MEDSPPRQQSLHNLGLPGSPGGSSILANAVAEKFKFRGNTANNYLHNDCDSLSCSPLEVSCVKYNHRYNTGFNNNYHTSSNYKH